MNRIELTRSAFIKSLLSNRWPQFLLTVLALVGFVLAIAAGLVGTRVGNRNFGVIFTWIVWWGALILIALPFLGRGWCSICPIPAPGEWLQRGSLLAPNGKGGLGLGRRWPRKLRNIWLQNAAFLLVALFSSVVLTQPRVTGIVLVGFLTTALGISLSSNDDLSAATCAQWAALSACTPRLHLWKCVSKMQRYALRIERKRAIREAKVGTAVPGTFSPVVW